MSTADETLRRMIDGFGITTAEILYAMPDTPSWLQVFFWQFEDQYPTFPRLKRFINYWRTFIEVPIKQITICHQRLIKPAEVRMIGNEFTLQ